MSEAATGAPGTPLREMARLVDERLESLHGAIGELNRRLGHIADDLHQAAGHTRTSRWSGPWQNPLSDAITAAEAKEADTGRTPADLKRYRDITATIDDVRTEISELDQVYNEHQWRRAFLVTNDNGHVHSSLSCSTCRPTTTYEWLSHYSAATEEETVEAAGETACTVCYPSAPSELLNRAPELISRHMSDKLAKAEAAAEAKMQREAKKIAKAVTKDGTPLHVPALREYETDYDRGGELTNEITATRLWVDIELSKATEYAHMKPTERHEQTQRTIMIALAGKHGRTVEEQQQVLQAKAAAKAQAQARSRR